MILFPFRRSNPDSIVAGLYGTIVAQARTPTFYSSYSVPDTVGGRFDMIVLHLVLFLRRLKRESEPVQALGQEVFNLFCRDIDDNFREMGMGDLAVPKNMRKVGEAFYGRAQSYEEALASGDGVLIDALTRNVFGKSAPGAPRLAAYVRTVVRDLEQQNDFSRGELRFLSPEVIDVASLESGLQS